MMGGGYNDENTESTSSWMNEYICSLQNQLAKRQDRWKEELSLVRHEMLWTTLWFEYQKNEWKNKAEQSVEPEKEAYAYKQAELWDDFIKKANFTFQGKQVEYN
ncbi:hypothetical protein ID866_12244 [Astraeus odoratus]|nr:hypothetical protein ID866_12244 [Astraeus odoratus]